MAKTVADVMKMVKDNEVKFVDFRFTDTRGKEQHVSVPVSAFDEDKFSGGHAFDGPADACLGKGPLERDGGRHGVEHVADGRELDDDDRTRRGHVQNPGMWRKRFAIVLRHRKVSF